MVTIGLLTNKYVILVAAHSDIHEWNGFLARPGIQESGPLTHIGVVLLYSDTNANISWAFQTPGT